MIGASLLLALLSAPVQAAVPPVECAIENERTIAKGMKCKNPRLCDVAGGDWVPDVEESILSMWEPGCEAYALMPAGWNHWTPAHGYFAVGHALDGDLINWRNGDGSRYKIEQAFLDGHFGPEVLLVVNEMVELWGCGEDSRVPVAVAALRDAGICINASGGIYNGSLHRKGLGFATHSVLVVCESAYAAGGFDLHVTAGKAGLETSEEWAVSGVLGEHVLERLGKLPGHEIVCVTPELAEERRRGRVQQRE